MWGRNILVAALSKQMMMSTIFFSNLVCKGAYTLTLGSALIGGHLTLGYLLTKPDTLPLETYFSIVLIVIGTNFVYFLLTLVLQLFPVPMKVALRKASLGMLSNIPIAIFYLYILVTYGF